MTTDREGSFGASTSDHFGTSHEVAAQMWTKLLTGENAPTLGFWYQESCYARLDKKPEVKATLTGLENLKAFYLSGGEMWYRNLNWADILLDVEAHGDSALLLQEILLGVTAKIPNNVPVDEAGSK